MRSRPRHAAGRWALVTRFQRRHRTGRPHEALRGTVAAPMGPALPRSSRPGNRMTCMARSSADVAADGSARPDSWRPFCPGLHRRTVRASRSHRSVRAVRRAQTRAAATSAVEVSPADPLNLVGIILPGARVSALRGWENYGSRDRLLLLPCSFSTVPPRRMTDFPLRRFARTARCSGRRYQPAPSSPA